MKAEQLTALLGRDVLSVERRPFPYASSHPLDVLDLRLADGTTLRLVLKDTSALIPAARGAKPRFLYDPEREREVYGEVLAGSGVPVPRLVAFAGSRLLLEYVEGTPLTEVGDFRIWEDAARAIGRMHRTLRGRETPHLVRYDNALFARWLDRAQTFADGHVDGLGEAYLEAVERLLLLPKTVIHGELYPANVLVRGEETCILDWESAGVGPGLLDLAAFTSGAWTALEREALVSAYASGLDNGTGTCDVLLDLERCRLVLAVQWLGWSRTWAPPLAQRQDWLAEAKRAASVLA